MIKIFYDLKTTGTNPNKHSIYQIAGLIEIDEELVETFDFETRPHPKAAIEPEAMTVGKVTKEEIAEYRPMKEVHGIFKDMLGKYINQMMDKKIKAHQVGFNNRAFDDIFLRKWFEQCGDEFYLSWFYPDTLDVMVLASEYLLDRRIDMPSFKLKRVAMELGLDVDKDRLHDGLYDAKLTRDIYRIVTGREIEL